MLEIEVASSRIISLSLLPIFVQIILKNICRWALLYHFFYQEVLFWKRIHFYHIKSIKKGRKLFFLVLIDRQDFVWIHPSPAPCRKNIFFLVCPSYIQFFLHLFLPFLWRKKWAHFFFTIYTTARPKKFSVDSSKKSCCCYCERAINYTIKIYTLHLRRSNLFFIRQQREGRKNFYDRRKTFVSMNSFFPFWSARQH